MDFKTRASTWQESLNRNFGENSGLAYYAAKAFISKEIAGWIAQAGLGLDVCTGGELAVAKAAEFPAERIELHGNNKSESEISDAIDYRVGTIVIDSLQEIERVARIAHNKGVVQKVLLRLTPGVEAHTHEAISTAHEDVKFGFSIASGAAWEAVEKIAQLPDLELRGVHCHIGSQIFGTDAFEIAADRLLAFMAKYRDTYGTQLPKLDLGGGYGIAYIEGETTVEPEDVLPTLGASVRTACAKYSLDIPAISIEPGRNIVGPTMFTLYEVGTVKDVTLENGTHRRYISVDGGMSDNIRPSLYGAEYTAILANRTSTAVKTSSRLVGKHCETGDIIIREIDLPEDIVPGDLLAVPATGAYGRSMASNYNHVPRPSVVAVKDGKARVIVRRESIEDLLALDI